ncbi:MAG: phage portal protein [Eubacteriales bacterium]|nr:phage portal protein [Eubacteriales bacterium]
MDNGKIIEYLARLGYHTPADRYAEHIRKYLCWYRGYVSEFHDYTMRVGTSRRTLTRYRLGMAKTVCEDFATLLLNEKVQINAEGFPSLAAILERNAFMERANRLVEWTMALGTGALVEFLDERGRPAIDYIRGDLIFPLRWDGDVITECAFGSRRVLETGGHAVEGYYVQVHAREGDGYVIRNAWLDDAGAELPPPEGVQAVTAPSPVPLFQILRPNVVNAVEPDSPMGMSVFGMAIDQLKAADLVFDSYVNEFVLGKKRVMVPQSLASIEMQKDGSMQPIFDPSDVLIYVYQQSQDGTDDLKPLDMTLRSAEHEAGLQRMIDLLSKKCGLGTGRYRFDGSVARTATEVISEQSDLYQSLKRNEKPLKRALCDMVDALSWLTGGPSEVKTTVSFDDSIIEDEGAAVSRTIQLVNGGLKSRKRAIMELSRCSEAEAEKQLWEIAAEQRGELPEPADNPANGDMPASRVAAVQDVPFLGD